MTYLRKAKDKGSRMKSPSVMSDDNIIWDHIRLLGFDWICWSFGGGKVGRFSYDTIKLIWFFTEKPFVLLTYISPILHSYRKQSVDFHCISITWFPYKCMAWYKLKLTTEITILNRTFLFHNCDKTSIYQRFKACYFWDRHQISLNSLNVRSEIWKRSLRNRCLWKTLAKVPQEIGVSFERPIEQGLDLFF